VIDDGNSQATSNYSLGKVTIDATAPVLTAEPNGGTYLKQVTVALSMEKPGTIYYTLDSSTPNPSSLVYSTPIVITQNTVLKAVAIDTLGNESELLEQEYVIKDNTPPSISGTPVTSVDEDVPYLFTPTASDPDLGDVLTFSIVNKPAWAVFSTSTGSLTGTPTNADVGLTTGIVITVKDSLGASASLPAFDLLVKNVNDPPIISGTPATSVDEDIPYLFTPTASDPDAGDVLTFSIVNKPAWLSFNPATGSLSGTPTNADVGTTHGIIISVAEASGVTAALAPFDLTVVNVNDPPMISGTPSSSVKVNSPYAFTPVASDPDVGDVLTFSIINKPQWASFSPATGSLTGTPGQADVGVTTGIIITVADRSGVTAALTPFSLTVTGPDNISVKVLTSKDKPLSNITVYAYQANGAYTGKKATTDANGLALFNPTDFTAGSYKFRADYLNIKFWSANVDLPASSQVSVTVPVETVEVTVTAGGRPASGVKVYLFSETGSYLGQMFSTDAQGKSIFELPVGYKFKFRADLLANQYWSDLVQVNGGAINYVAIAAGGGKLLVTVEQEEQKPLAGLKVYLFNPAGSYLGLNQTTDAAGQAAFDLSAGSYKVRIDWLGYQFWSEVVTVTADTTLLVPIPHKLVKITLLEQFEDEASPVAGQKVYLFNSAGTYVGLSQTTDSNGQVVFNVPNTAYKVRADYLYQQYWSADFTWQDQTITVPLAQAEVAVTGTGMPKKDIKVYAYTAKGNYLGLSAKTDSEGKVLFELPTGTYKFRVDYQDSQFWSSETELPADHVTPVSISIGGGNFTLTLFKAQDQPLANVKCYAFTAGGTYIGLYGATDDQGQVAFALSSGSFKFRIDYLGHQYWSEVYNIPVDSAAQLLIEHAGLDLLVRQASGPVNGIKVYLYGDNANYLGQVLTTAADGRVGFALPVGLTFKFRADILGHQYWSDLITIASGANNLMLDAGGGRLQIKVLMPAEIPAQGLKVYLFNEKDAYTGLEQDTDSDGLATFNVPKGIYKARVDYLGQQFWTSPTEITTDTLVAVNIPHQSVKINVNTNYQGALAALPGVKIYLFNTAGSYVGLTQVTDTNGQVSFLVPEKSYKARIDYLGKQFWTPEFVWQDQAVTIPLADVEVTVTGAGLPQKGLKVYLFSQAGTYLGQTQNTDDNGQVHFRTPEGVFKFRADYQTNQFWSAEQSLIPDQVNKVIISVGGGTFVFKAMQNNSQPLEGIKVYVFNQKGNYIGLVGATDQNGEVTFALANGIFKFRLDYLGYQFWSDPVTVPDVLSAAATIEQQEVQAQVQSLYNNQAELRAGLRLDLFTQDIKYAGLYQITDANGQAVFKLPNKPYKLRANYLGKQFWSAEFTWQPISINIPVGLGRVQVRMLEQNLANIPVYLFSSTDTYLGVKGVTDTDGQAVFKIPEGSYKFRADYQGHQYWGSASIIKDVQNDILIQTGGGQFILTVGTGQASLADAKIYVFTETGAYIGLNAGTDIDGKAAFNLAGGSYKFRIDYLGYQFWTGIFTIPSTLSESFVIQHQDIKITVLGSYGQPEPLAGLNTYLYKPNGSYLGQTQKTDSSGQVMYKLPDQEYKVRADYLGQKFWTDVFKSHDATLNIPEGLVRLQVTQAGNPAPNLNVYLFNETGTYLGWSAKTNADGRVEVILPNQAFKFRVDKAGKQYWSPVVQVNAGEVNEVEVAVE
jgi:uncharacterized GH25 family protein